MSNFNYYRFIGQARKKTAGKPKVKHQHIKKINCADVHIYLYIEPIATS